MNKSTQDLERYIRARFPIINIISHEESRVMKSVLEMSKNMKKSDGKKIPRIVVEWTLTKGFEITSSNTQIEGLPDPKASANPYAALSFISTFDLENNHTPVLFILKDLHKIVANDPKVVRHLRDIYAHLESRKHNVVLLSPEPCVSPDIEKQVAVIDWALPDASELEAVLAQAEIELPAELNQLNGKRDAVVQAMRGLTVTEAAGALTAGVIASGKLDDSVVSFILNEKKQVIRKSGVLEYFEASTDMSEVGGNDNMKEYAAMVRRAMTKEARDAGVDTPKGVVFVGPPGTGKTLGVKALAGSDFPLVRLDIAKLIEGTVGSGARNLMKALKVVEAVSPCFMLIDEAEKAFTDNGGASDGGEMMRIIGTFLTWMQENELPIYTAMTVNGMDSLRPELLSRFDDVMFVDLPDAQSREEIIKVHLKKRNVKKIDALDEVITATYGYSGREIEKAVKFAIKKAFFENKPVSSKYLLEAAKGIVPTLETKREEIERLRNWAETRAIPAGRPLEPTKPVVKAAKAKLEI